ncbi:MAG: penicillin-binding protein 2 [Gammaproteobacteria bacterium]|nr:penicillin-binding protein 2 [Gammaproteobacteria bacterium]
MPPEFHLKDPGYEYRLISRRIYFAGMLMFLLGLLIVVRVFFLQVVMHDHFTTLSQHNRVKIQPIAPIRGLIFSNDGVLLANNRPSFSLEVIPEQVDDIEQTIDRLSGLIELDNSDIERFRKQLKRKHRFVSVPLKFNLSDDDVAILSVNRHLFPGVDVVAGLNRYYPLAEKLAHVSGYVGMIDEDELELLDTSNYKGTSHIGKLGVEQAYENLLHGSVGYRQVEVNATGRIIRLLDRTAPVSGKNIYLTLDVSLQNLAVKALDGKRGAIVAIDPRDGGILAMVSAPGYDPNPFVNGIDSASYKKLLNSSDSPLLNRALQGKYPPGSTIKPFFAFAALDYGLRTNLDETWCQGWYSLKGSTHRYRDWKKTGHGHTNLENAVAQSCDVYFYALAHEMGIERVHEVLAKFGFGERTNIDIVGEAAGLNPSREWKRRAYGQAWYPGETLIVGIGQGSSLVTPVHLAVATAAIANRGKLVRPHLFANARDSITNEVVDEFKPEIYGRVEASDQSHWQTVIDSMTEVTHGQRGTARRVGKGAAYMMAGKTGTAQVIAIAQDEEYDAEEVREEFRDHALFIAFAPVENPRIALVIVVENGGSGSSGAAPIARVLFDHHLQGINEAESG